MPEIFVTRSTNIWTKSHFDTTKNWKEVTESVTVLLVMPLMSQTLKDKLHKNTKSQERHQGLLFGKKLFCGGGNL